MFCHTSILEGNQDFFEESFSKGQEHQEGRHSGLRLPMAQEVS
jgi:hypothetical protein